MSDILEYAKIQWNHNKNIVICSSNSNNDKLFYKKLSYKYKVGVFFGSENNMLKRIIDCLEKNKFKHFVRLTGDNPLVDIDGINKLLNKHIFLERDGDEVGPFCLRRFGDYTPTITTYNYICELPPVVEIS